MDTPSSAHPFCLKLTVPPGVTAVGPGQLHRVSETLDRRKQYEYRVKLDTPPCHVSFVSGQKPLQISYFTQLCLNVIPVSIQYRTCAVPWHARDSFNFLLLRHY